MNVFCQMLSYMYKIYFHSDNILLLFLLNLWRNYGKCVLEGDDIVTKNYKKYLSVEIVL